MTIDYIKIRRWYLEMQEAPGTNPMATPDGIVVKKLQNISCAEYRVLNKTVGHDVQWVDRQIMPEAKLKAIIENPSVEIFGLYDHDVLAGYAELSKSEDNEVELHYFGLVTAFRGKGLGKYFLRWLIAHVWAQKPTRFKLNTCEHDSPGALTLYQQEGFELVDTRMDDQAVIRS